MKNLMQLLVFAAMGSLWRELFHGRYAQLCMIILHNSEKRIKFVK